eukprot:scaffold105450_cov66-Phaeocystis_antarctica.AAC.1
MHCPIYALSNICTTYALCAVVPHLLPSLTPPRRRARQDYYHDAGAHEASGGEEGRARGLRRPGQCRQEEGARGLCCGVGSSRPRGLRCGVVVVVVVG